MMEGRYAGSRAGKRCHVSQRPCALPAAMPPPPPPVLTAQVVFRATGAYAGHYLHSQVRKVWQSFSDRRCTSNPIDPLWIPTDLNYIGLASVSSKRVFEQVTDHR